MRLIAEGVGSVSFVLYEGAGELTQHSLRDLMARPDPRLEGATFLEAVSSHLLLAGNAYIEAGLLAIVAATATKCASFTRCAPAA